MSAYLDFLAGKLGIAAPVGIEAPANLCPALKPFQRDITAWALKRGRAAIFAGTGLGKTVQQLSWARAVADFTGGRVLIVAPLAVAEQTIGEAAKFGIPGIAYAPDGDHITSDLVITNYDRADRFDMSDFAGVVLDESSILKASDSKTRAMLTASCAVVPYRLCCTATPAPNDWTEIGQHSEFLGVMSAKEMLAMYFVHDGSVRAGDAQGKGSDADGWRLKRHAARDFWRWVASWAVMIRSPSDLGYDEPGYNLPPLIKHQITVPVEYRPSSESLFPIAARTLAERLAARRTSIPERVAAAVELVNSCIADGKMEPCQQPKNVAAPRKKTPNTCGHTDSGTGKNGTAPESSKIRSTLPGGSGTPPTQPSPTNARHTRGNDAPLKSETADCERNSALVMMTMPPCSSSKAVSVQSARAAPDLSEACDSRLTTATRRELSEGFCAQTAIRHSVSSPTTQTGLTAPSNTSLKDAPRPWLVWCALDAEQRALERAFGDRCFSVYGSMSSEQKIAAIHGWLNGERPILVTKVKICGWGLNFQHCADQIFVGLNDSFEQLFQAIRRCWRFGQTKPVNVYMVASEIEGAVVANLDAKERAFDAMVSAMAEHMTDLSRRAIRGGRQATSDYNPTIPMEIPTWLTAA